MIYYNGMLYEDLDRLSEYLYMPNAKNFNTENINISYSLNDMSRFLLPGILDSRITYKGSFKVVFGLPAEVSSQISEVIFPPTTDNSEESRATPLLVGIRILSFPSKSLMKICF